MWRGRGSGSGGTAGEPAAGGVLDDALELTQQHGLRLGADDLLDDLSTLVDVHRRDLEHTRATGDLRVLVDVQLDDLDLVAVLLGDLLEDRRDLAARAAPFGPEVDQHGLVALEDLSGERGVGDCLHGAFLTSRRGRPASARSRETPSSRSPLR